MMERRGEKGSIVDSAIERGIEEILKVHPKLRGAEEYIVGHIDKEELAKDVHRVQKYIKRNGKNWDEDRKLNFFYKTLANYVASGKVLDNQAKEVILKKGLEEKIGQGGKSNLEGEEDVDKVVVAFRDLYKLMKTGDYGHRMPELASAVTTINDLGFLDSAIDVLKSYKLLDHNKYRAIKEEIKERYVGEQKKFGESFERYIRPKKGKIAAAIIGIAGAGILASGLTSTITGNVIGNSGENFGSTIFGIGLLIISGVLFLRK